MKDTGGKMQRYYWDSNQPNGCKVHTFGWLRRHVSDVDALDTMHRLLKTKVPETLIAEATGFPIESVLHVKETNYGPKVQHQRRRKSSRKDRASRGSRDTQEQKAFARNSDAIRLIGFAHFQYSRP